MKRALSLVLAIVMVLSLSVTAMAAWVVDLPTLPTRVDATGSAVTPAAPSGWNVSVGNWTRQGPNYTQDAGDIAGAGTRIHTATVTLTANRVDAFLTGAGTLANTPAGTVNNAFANNLVPGATVSGTGPTLSEIPGRAAGASVANDPWDAAMPTPATVTFTISADLGAVWNEGSTGGGGGNTGGGGGGNNNAAVRQVPNGWRVDGVVDGASFVDQMNALWNRDRVRGDDEVRIGLTPADFEWRVPRNARRDASNNLIDTRASGWDSVSWTVAVNEYTDSANRAGLLNIGNRSDALQTVHFDRVQLRTTRTVGMNGTIRDVTFHRDTGARDNTVMAIRIRTEEFMTRVGNNTVEFDLNLSVTGSSNRPIGRVSFNVRNDDIVVQNNQEYIDPSHTDFIIADETVRNLEIYAGNGVTFRRNITSGQELYVATELATHDGFEELFRQHADLVDVIRVHTSNGWNAAAVTASIESADTLFVWNEQRNLIGTTADERLPFSNLYFLTTTQSIPGFGGNAETPAPEVPGGGDVDNENLGGDGPSTPNSNFNPGTGR